LRQAALFEARYTYGGQGARGMSLFAASSAVDELAVLEIRRHLERISCGILARLSLPEKRETPGSTPDPGVSASDLDQTS
jgi:hypothetical protein